MTTDGALHLGPDFAGKLLRALPRLLATGALPDDWDPRATTYDLPRFDSDIAFAARFEQALSEIDAADLDAPRVRDRLAAAGLPFDYARLGQPLSTVYELYTQSRTNAARCFSFASVTKPWLAVLESPDRTLPVRVYARDTLPISDEKRRALTAAGCAIHERWSEDLPARSADVLTVHVTDTPFVGDVQASAADAVCFAVPRGGCS
ncbi:MAG: hypothetical protein IPJ34_06405 [Myxococcales bacterium]|nr:hypothetical protein [Myxococcales bacterium]